MCWIHLSGTVISIGNSCTGIGNIPLAPTRVLDLKTLLAGKDVELGELEGNIPKLKVVSGKSGIEFNN